MLLQNSLLYTKSNAKITGSGCAHVHWHPEITCTREPIACVSRSICTLMAFFAIMNYKV